jgi:hypothetical protein
VTIKWNGQLAKLLAKIEEEKQEIKKKIVVLAWTT